MNHWKSKFQIWVLHAGSQSFFGPPIRLSHKLIVQRAVVFFRNANGLASKISKGNRHRHQNTNAEQCFRLFVAIAADQILQPHINAVTPRYAATPMFGWWVVVTASCLHFGPTFGCGGPLQTLMDFQSLSSALAAIGTPTAWQTFIADDWDVSEEFFVQFCQSFLPAAPPVEPFLYQQVNISNISHFEAHALVNVQMQGRSIVLSIMFWL